MTTDDDARAACLALLDGLEDTAADLGLRLAAIRREIDPALQGELRLTIEACDERLRWASGAAARRKRPGGRGEGRSGGLSGGSA
jgi:hypothetical protein